MATRTAPTVDGAPALKRVSLGWIDDDGDMKSYSFYCDGASTAAEIEGYADSIVPASNASLWSIEVSEVYEGIAIKSNADSAPEDSVQDVILVTYKNPTTKQTFRSYVPAPKTAMLVTGSEVVDTADALFTAWLAGVSAILPAGYSPVTARFNKHREINESIGIG